MFRAWRTSLQLRGCPLLLSRGHPAEVGGGSLRSADGECTRGGRDRHSCDGFAFCVCVRACVRFVLGTGQALLTLRGALWLSRPVFGHLGMEKARDDARARREPLSSVAAVSVWPAQDVKRQRPGERRAQCPRDVSSPFRLPSALTRTNQRDLVISGVAVCFFLFPSTALGLVVFWGKAEGFESLSALFEALLPSLNSRAFASSYFPHETSFNNSPSSSKSSGQ